MVTTEQIALDHYLLDLKSELDPAAQDEFRPIEMLMLKMAMIKCGMTELPAVTTDVDRCSGEMICQQCGNTFYAHPEDWRLIGYGNRPFMNILCDGRRVKL